MGKLRHVALVVQNLEESAKFYETVFDMKRAYEVKDVAVYLTDGVMNLAILNYAKTNREGAPTADGVKGTHHFGFRVSDLAESQEKIEALGGQYCFDLGDPKGMNFERKFRDPEGIIFDISEKGWYGALDETASPALEPATP
jgi:catechol 2,3-dioxygenase-like lactoylglutathione lyase family enzyme